MRLSKKPKIKAGRKMMKVTRAMMIGIVSSIKLLCQSDSGKMIRKKVFVNVNCWHFCNKMVLD